MDKLVAKNWEYIFWTGILIFKSLNISGIECYIGLLFLHLKKN